MRGFLFGALPPSLQGSPAVTSSGARGCVSRLGQSQPRQTASLCCIGDQPRQFRTLLRDFRRPCPCCTHRLHPPFEPPLGPTHQFRRSKKLLPRHHFHDPPPDGPIRRIELRPPIAALSWLAQLWRRSAARTARQSPRRPASPTGSPGAEERGHPNRLCGDALGGARITSGSEAAISLSKDATSIPKWEASAT